MESASDYTVTTTTTATATVINVEKSCERSLLQRTFSLSFTGGDLSRGAGGNKVKETSRKRLLVPGIAGNLSKKTTKSNHNSIPDSSNGFKNTIAVLEKYVKQRKVWNVADTLVPSSEQETATVEPTGLELQLMAIERLKQISETSRLAFLLLNYIIFSENLDVTGERKKDRIRKLAENLQKDTTDCLYHIAKEKNGLLYLKVFKSPNKERVLSGNRVSQMTRTFDDPEAITRLLEEKEKDLELTVQIGKELLAQNNQLETRVAELEADLNKASENLNQLTHELQQKNELINVLTNDLDDGSESGTPLGARSINIDILQRKVSALETENKQLKSEAAQIAEETTVVEEQERKLMEDIAYQLNSANSESHAIRLELERYKEENRLQQEQIINLTARLHSTELRLHELLSENEETSSLLHITKENQNALAIELAEFKTKYTEVLNLLRDAQEQLKKQKRRSVPVARSSLFQTSCGKDSLQSELMETSMLSENSLDSGIVSDHHLHLQSYPKPNAEFHKVFETVKCANENIPSDAMSRISAMSIMSSQSSQPRMSPMLMTQFSSSASQSRYRNTSLYGLSEPTESMISGPTFKHDFDTQSVSDERYPAPAPVGVPGCPGAKDLETALSRLTPAEILARRAMLSHSSFSVGAGDDSSLESMPGGIRTPDSTLSGGSGHTNFSSLSSAGQWKIPEKLQIVKPIEGSQTLFHWQKLAQPTLGGLLEERTGIAVRGGRTLDDLGLHIYSLEDVEEDEELVPQKRFQQSAYTNTYTMSTVMHPDDGTASVTFSLPPSQMSSRVNSVCSSRQASAPSTPRASLSRRNSCSTFSVHMGLASVLNERGIKAVTPSVLNTPTGANYSPTVTPCNSPDGSPVREIHEPPLISGLLASGAELLRRKLIGASGTSPVERPSRIQTRNKIALSRLEKKALKQIKIMEKVESIGVDNIMQPAATTVSPLALHSTSMYNSARARRSESPMTQLTSFKHLGDQAKKKDGDNVVIDKHTIRAVLCKGLSKQDSDSSSGTSSISMELPSQSQSSATAAAATTKVKGPTETSAVVADSCVRRMQRQKSRRNMINSGQGARRPDLGTVSSVHRTSVNDLGSLDTKSDSSKQNEGLFGASSVVGTISSLLFGRKGGFT